MTYCVISVIPGISPKNTYRQRIIMPVATLIYMQALLQNFNKFFYYLKKVSDIILLTKSVHQKFTYDCKVKTASGLHAIVVFNTVFNVMRPPRKI